MFINARKNTLMVFHQIFINIMVSDRSFFLIRILGQLNPALQFSAITNKKGSHQTSVLR